MGIETYEIRVAGELDDCWKTYFEPLAYSRAAEGETAFVGEFGDQAELIAALRKFQSVNVQIRSIVLLERSPCMSSKQLKPFGGIVPAFAPVFFAALAAAVIGTIRFREFFRIPYIPTWLRLSVGAAIALVMIPFYASTVRVFLSDFKTGKVVIRGTYAFCRNPIYATWIVFLLPSAALLADSWLLVAADLALYGVFKLLIPREYAECREAFGEEYVRYERSVGELFPAFWKPYRNEEYHAER